MTYSTNHIEPFTVRMVHLPEHKAGHSPDRACLFVEQDEDGWWFVVPYSRSKDRSCPELSLWPDGVGGRNSDGYLVPRLQGWVHPSRVRRFLGELDGRWEDVAVTDMRTHGSNYDVNEYGQL